MLKSVLTNYIHITESIISFELILFLDCLSHLAADRGWIRLDQPSPSVASIRPTDVKVAQKQEPICWFRDKPKVLSKTVSDALSIMVT
jgi:hypothetical protein